MGIGVGTNKTISYKNTYIVTDDDLIAAVWTYFVNNLEDYTLEVYVNNQLKLTQKGTGPYFGYHIIKLIKHNYWKRWWIYCSNDKNVPILEQSRQHYINNTSFVNFGSGWYDLIKDDTTTSLKVYTIGGVIITEDLVIIYKNDSKFEAKIGVAN